MNCSIANQIARVQFAVFEKCTSAYLSQIVRGKTCDYLLMMYMKKLDSVFLLVVFISCHVLLARPLAFVRLPE